MVASKQWWCSARSLKNSAPTQCARGTSAAVKSKQKSRSTKISLGANRQLIVELFPTVHRGAFVASDRQFIVEIGGGGDCCSRHVDARLVPFVRCLRPRVSASDSTGNLTNGRENQALRCPITGLRCHSP